jgi:hypothetical protein
MMSEAAAEANIRFANTDIVLTSIKARTDSSTTNSEKSACRRRATDQFDFPQIGRERCRPILKGT